MQESSHDLFLTAVQAVATLSSLAMALADQWYFLLSLNERKTEHGGLSTFPLLPHLGH